LFRAKDTVCKFHVNLLENQRAKALIESYSAEILCIMYEYLINQYD
jgi:hypothetical protein